MAKTRRRRTGSRATPVLVVIALVVIVFAGRLVSLQVIDANAINAEADGRRGQTSTLYGTRGSITDANGTMLASSVDRFDITLAPVNMRDFKRLDPETNKYVDVTVEESLEKIAELTDQDASDLASSVDAVLAANPEAAFGYLAQGVTLEQYQAVRDLGIPWVYFERHPERTYPNGAVAGNLTGFVGSDGTPLAGLELQYDQCLAGQNGEESFERSADGVAIPGSVVTLSDPVQGGTLKLSIDSDTQWRTQQIIAEQVEKTNALYGTITVVNVKTGQLVAAAEYPTVDPNSPGESDTDDRGARTFTAPYEPGSIMKPITASMLYDQGLVDPDETITVPDTWDQKGAEFGDDSPHDPVEMNMNGVLTESSNVGTATFADRLSPEARHDYLLSYGLNEQTGVNFLGEESGIVRPAEEWDPQTNYATTFGHGLTATVAQMASAYQALANGGSHIPLQLVLGCTQEDGTVTDQPDTMPTQVVSAEAAELALEGMESVAREGWLADQVEVPGYRVGIKTGTSERVDADTGTYIVGSNNVSMAGVAPMDDPQYVVLVTLADPTTITTSAATAPAWQSTMSYVLSSNNVSPSPQPYPDINIVH
ncbi:peptidoglycan D,D-transpeptidase FtsI family protein [Gulosibacter sp. ACHW.36C]|uniref:Penicillin-binding protein 2 n=1 Tax=Gulosibacter sediminis TaxID=1729695 RepID=A0ABY4MXH3_9MICO|nr:penicillin-binding protein 2 [Gulosibacter sediminis]UQN13897.1 penicillin-binding protein 2 [Gulosibacter sediminis]